MELDAATDALTGQGNRRALDEVLKQQAASYLSGGRSFSILMLDIDFFKTINDGFGHLVGDDVLRAFSQRVRASLRPTDVCTRFGGEEFVVVLPETTLEEAQEVAERLRLGVAQSPLLQTPTVQVTVSIGVATLAPNQTVGDLLANADASEYAAKNAGRNQVHPRKVHTRAAGAAAARHLPSHEVARIARRAVACCRERGSGRQRCPRRLQTAKRPTCAASRFTILADQAKT